MAVTPGIVRSFKVELLQAIHNLGSDTIKLALYDTSAELGPTTTAYSATNEITGSGYTDGGFEIDVASGYPQWSSAFGAAEVRFDTLTVNPTTFGAKAGLIYNATRANRAIAVVDFGSVRNTTNGPFVVRFPAAQPAVISIV